MLNVRFLFLLGIILAEPHGSRFVLHDRDSIYSPWLDAAVTVMGVRVLRRPHQAPAANCYCERVLAMLRRECLDFLIPLGEAHLRRVLRTWRVIASWNPGCRSPRPAWLR